MMEKEKIVLDVDDVLGEFVKPLNDYYNGIRGTAFRFEDYTTYSLHEVWGCSREYSIEVIHEFFKTSAFDNLEPTMFSQEVLNWLRPRKDFVAVSYRPEILTELTREWIGDTFFGMETFCVGSYDHFSGPVETKLSVCKRLGSRAIVEDNPKTASECAADGIMSLLMDKPWNEVSLYNGFRRAADWNEVPGHLEGKI